MHGWSGALFVATGLSALFAFGLVQTTFAPQAQALFFVFSVVLVLVTVGNWVGHEHGHAAASIGKKIGLVAILGGLIAVIYAWVDNDWTAEKAGREVDRATVGLYRQAAATVADLRAPQQPAEEEETQVQ
jgi:hypothetical protein